MSGYIGQSPVALATQTRDAFTATAAQTSFATSGYTPGYLDVYLNGVKLAAADYTATNNSDVVLTVGAALNDILEVVAYATFETFNETFTGTTTVDILAATGNITAAGTVTTGDVTFSNTNPLISTSGQTGSLTISGDADGVSGANMLLYGSSHATLSDNILFRHNTLKVLEYDANTEVWDFQVTDITTTGTVTASGITLDNTNPNITSSDADGFLVITGGTSGALGGNMRIYGPTHASFANDILFRTTTTSQLRYDDSAATWDFIANDIKTTGTIETTGGIYLGGTAAANLMDDYEEGTWTPTLSDGTNTATTHTHQIGTYTRVGNVVTIEGRCGVSNLGSVAGSIQITGLPFTSRTLANSRAIIVCGAGAGLAITANQSVVARVNNNTAYLALTLWDDITGNTNMTETEFTASGDITFSGVYYV